MSEPVRILLTGANGFVGVNLGSFLSKSGLDVLRTDISSSDVNGDLTDASFVLKVLGNQDFDSVVHLAGLINVPKSIDDPYTCYRINCFGTLNLRWHPERRSSGSSMSHRTMSTVCQGGFL